MPRHITVAEMAPHIHSFEVNENKVNKISCWLIKWITNSLQNGKVEYGDFLPSKGDLAFHIGVSKGTIQNVFRQLEDSGYVESKQRLGTFIKNIEEKNTIEKLTSKREIIAEKIKEHIITNDYNAGDCLISTRKLAELFEISNATVRTAMNSLISEGVIEKKNNSFVVKNLNFKKREIENKTLVEKIADDIQKYIEQDFSCGDKLPPNTKLGKKFNVSVKTIHDAIKILSKKGIVVSRRGQYGTTILLGKNNENQLYNYEHVELKIRHYIAENCEVSSRLPSILDFSKMYSVSPKTVKKALDNLAEDGYLTFSRGRWGGTFVMDIPQTVNEAYKWIALNTNYVSEMEN